MQDLISRQAAIDLLKQMRKDGNMVPWEGKDVFDRIRKLPSVQPEPQWIPCSERLPYVEYGESDTVLTTCGYRDVEDTSVRWIRLLYFNGGNWCYPTGGTYEAKVYAWMPLPDPWRGEEHGET